MVSGSDHPLWQAISQDLFKPTSPIANTHSLCTFPGAVFSPAHSQAWKHLFIQQMPPERQHTWGIVSETQQWPKQCPYHHDQVTPVQDTDRFIRHSLLMWGKKGLQRERYLFSSNLKNKCLTKDKLNYVILPLSKCHFKECHGYTNR